tara:strand:+ start:983 stop:1150 length:168 start_codon:yes stop_codon:yes gene_type:complete
MPFEFSPTSTSPISIAFMGPTASLVASSHAVAASTGESLSGVAEEWAECWEGSAD